MSKYKSLRGYPQSRGLILELKQQYEANVTGVILAEDLQSGLNRSIISWLLPTDDTLILEEETGESPSVSSVGSSVVRSYFTDHPEFFQSSESEIEEISLEDLPVILPVRKIIRETQLYHKNTTRLGFVQDWFWATFYGKE
jgi:hypothetical protein